MTLLDDQIQSLNDKVQVLLKKQSALLKENLKLQREKEGLSQQLLAATELVGQLQHKIDALKLNTTSLNAEVKKDLEKRISIYIKEIENCLSLLNA